MQPWLREDVDAVVTAPEAKALSDSPFVALHVRRGDKILYEGTRLIESEVCGGTVCNVPMQKKGN